MRQIMFISCVLLLTGLVFAQEYKPYNTFNKEAELQKFTERGGKVEEISPDVYRLTNRIGESRTFYLGKKENVIDNNKPVDTTIINVWEIDTTKFAGMFTFWQQVQVNNSIWAPLPIEDLNNNGYPELYGFTDVVDNQFFAGPVKIFERNSNGIFDEIFTFDSSTFHVKGIYDINKNGSKEIFIIGYVDEDSIIYHRYPVFKSDTAGSLPTTLDFFFYEDTLQINNMAFGDWDNNGINECAYTAISDTPMCAIAEYRDSLNNFKELFRFSSIYESDISGFAIDDFDQDDKTELVISSGPGNVFVIENKDKNEYSIVNQFPFPIPNTYMQTATRDIDENGKPEFWIGGQDFLEGVTIFQCYESDGDNSYKPVTRIELRYLVSFYNFYIQAVDIDDDGKEELIISIGNVILILKFVGSPDYHQYKLWYAKLGEETQPAAQFYPIAIADLDEDGKNDLLIPMAIFTPHKIYGFSYILIRDGTTRVDSTNSDYTLSEDFIKSYPIPFNSTSSVIFSIAKESFAKIKVYNSLGKEIKTLLAEQLTPGEYNLHWEAIDKYGNPLPSGIYFISLQTDNVFKTTKTIFLK